MTRLTGRARAHTNIALVKYWGKRDSELFLPMTNSLSLTLDALYTDTSIVFDSELTEDTFTLDQIVQSKDQTEKLTHFLDIIRAKAQITSKANVTSLNFVPTAAGLASSASAYAALIGACADALGWEDDHKSLSKLARRGSGSATRSLFGGFVEWDKGTDDYTSVAIPIDDGQWDIGLIVLVLNNGKKKISSRDGMAHTVATSPFYENWVKTVPSDIKQMKAAIYRKDIETIGEIAEHNALKMHATMLSANPPFWYFEPATLLAMERIRELRQAGYPAYFTMDAGPNVKIICQKSDMTAIMDELSHFYTNDQMITSAAGPDMRTLTEEEWAESLAKKEGSDEYSH